MPIRALYSPKTVEPAHGRRYARYECPIEGCTAPVICTRLMCAGHWRMVSPANKRQLQATYRQIKAWCTGDDRQLLSVYRFAHMDACEACIDDVEAQL